MTITGSTDWQDLVDDSTGAVFAQVTLTATLIEDDIVEVTSHFPAGSDGSCTAAFRASAYFSALEHEVSGSGSYGYAGTDVLTMNCSGVYTVPAGGASSVVVKLQGRISNAVQEYYVGDTSILLDVKVYRQTP